METQGLIFFFFKATWKEKSEGWGGGGDENSKVYVNPLGGHWNLFDERLRLL